MAFTFKGRIKSLIRLKKINGNITEYIYEYHARTGSYPSESDIKQQIGRIRDLIAYRIVLSLPECHIKDGESGKNRELELLYEIAGELPAFLEERGFNAEPSMIEGHKPSPRIKEELRPYFRDYIVNPSPYGYQSVHIIFYDNSARCFIEGQLRTKEMDDGCGLFRGRLITPFEHLSRFQNDLID